jgi:hypothetical protein
MYCTQTRDEDSEAKPKYRPAVKFRNIDEGVLQAVQTGSRNVADDDTPSEGEDESDSDNESDGGMDESMDAGPAPLQAFTFEIDVDIDIDSKALRDMIAVDRDQVQQQRPPKPAQAAQHAHPWQHLIEALEACEVGFFCCGKVTSEKASLRRLSL